MSELVLFFSKRCRPHQRDIKTGCAVFRQSEPAGDIFLVTGGRIRLVCSQNSNGDRL